MNEKHLWQSKNQCKDSTEINGDYKIHNYKKCMLYYDEQPMKTLAHKLSLTKKIGNGNAFYLIEI
jgi:hypothetical protein